MPDCYIVADCAWISTNPLSTSSNVIKETLITRYRDVQRVCVLDLMSIMKKGKMSTNKNLLKSYFFLKKVKQYFSYIIIYSVLLLILGILIGVGLSW